MGVTVTVPAWYLTIKHIHITLALSSLAGFLLRGALMMRQSVLLSHTVVRRLPHVNDSLLLLLGVTLLWVGPWTLASAGWLQLKLTLLLVYIGLGFIALHRGRFSRGQRVAAWMGAVTVFLCMLWLAYYKPF